MEVAKKESEYPFDYAVERPRCIFTALTAGTVSIGLGMAISFFFQNHSALTALETHKDATFWQKNVFVLKDSVKRGWSMGKTFFWFGLAFTGFECFLQRARSKRTPYDSLISGTVLGLAFAARLRPQEKIGACLFFGVFSLFAEFGMGGFGHRPFSVFSPPEP